MRYVLVALLLGSLGWSQKPVAAPPANPDAPVITINGLCDNPSAGAADCKTIITQAQFGKLVNAVQPNMRGRARREFALHYANGLVMAKKAEEMGLDKGADYEEQMKLARIDILSKALTKVCQEKASQISDKDIEDYYHSNIAKFEKVEMERIHIPRTREAPAGSERAEDAEHKMKEEADNLRVRAVAGEDFAKLQADAYQVAGIKNATPNTSIETRRISLPPNQVSVMDLKPGEVSSVFADPSGYVIYKVKAKITLPLDQAHDEIKATMRSERLEEQLNRIEESVSSTLDENFFRRTPPGGIRAGEPSKPKQN